MPQLLEDIRETANVLYYGDGGTGKSTAMAHMAKLGKVWVANAESGFKARALRQFDIPVENIEVFPGDDEVLSFDTLENEWMRIREELNEDPTAYVGTIMDSATEIHQVLVGDAAKRGYEKAMRQGKDRDPQFIALEDYGIMTSQMRSLIRRFRDLPCHFAISALAKREQDDDSEVTYVPQITAKLQTDLIGWVDIVCVTQVQEYNDDGEDEYRGLFRPTGKWRGKDRFKMLPKGIVDPTFDRIVQYIDGDLTIDEDPVMLAAKERAAANRSSAEPVPA
jgi:hypothetical protein